MAEEANFKNVSTEKMHLINWILQLKDEQMLLFLESLSKSPSKASAKGSLSSDEQAALEKSVREAAEGLFISHEDLMKESKQWV